MSIMLKSITRNLLTLPVSLGGLGLVNSTETSDKFQACMKLTAPLVTNIVLQDQTCEIDPNDVFITNS